MSSERRRHDLKCWPEYFVHVVTGSKTFEVRKDDRGFAEGDLICLHEWDPTTEKYSGRYVFARVGYILRDYCAAIPDMAGHVVFSLHDVSQVRAIGAASQPIPANGAKP